MGHNDYVTVSTYKIKSKSTGKEQLYYYLRLADAPMPKIYDNQNLPAYLFLGGSILSLIVIWLLVRQLPDLFRRTGIWLSTLGKYTVAFENSKYLPDTGPVIMVTNGHTREQLGDIHTCCDRQVQILNGRPEHLNGDVLEGAAALKADELLLISDNAPELKQLLSKLYDHNPAVRVLPITYRKDDKEKKAHVILHETVAPNIDLEQLQTLLRA
ncbi:MAG: hypothetical protein QM703_26130 [Gemmatales bacterium]